MEIILRFKDFDIIYLLKKKIVLFVMLNLNLFIYIY
jgi:hypothetical protein